MANGVADYGRQPVIFLDDGPTSKLIRQILGTVSECDNAMTDAPIHVGADLFNQREVFVGHHA